MKKLYSLIDKIYRRGNLEEAFKRVKKNKGAPGIDGESIIDFSLKLDENIALLHEQLKTNTYESTPCEESRNRKARWGN